MNSAPPDIHVLLKKLAESASWWSRVLESREGEEIDAIVSKLSPVELAALDQRVRGYSVYNDHDLNRWRGLRPTDVSFFAQSRYATSLVGLASCHYSGYVREAGVKQLALQRTGRELSFLLIRLNDWVPEVRQAAEQAIRARFDRAYAVHFLANIRLVLHLRACGRVNKQLVTAIFDLLKAPGCHDLLQFGMASKDKLTRRISFQLAAEADPATRYFLVQTLMNDPDAAARSWAVRHFLPQLAPDDLPGIAERMLNDRFMPIRREMLWALATKRPDLAAQPLRQALLDDHLSMRETGRQFLSIIEIADVRDFYLEAVKSGPETQRVAAVCGLGETGRPADVGELLALVDSPSVKLRRAVVYAIGKLDAEACIPKLTAFLADPKASVSRAAMKAVMPKVGQLPLQDLEQMISHGVSFHVRRNALTLVVHAGKWRKLPALLNACADEDARVAGLAATALRDWSRNYNQSVAEPTRADFERISAVLKELETQLPHGTAKELRGCLNIYFQ